ncbi:tryptophan--tRNA ligase [Candidatus Uhrbacteria bacterium]|nr:tryptophan--tRNA ligase [Candidatus Uhrbacteria bacterium]
MQDLVLSGIQPTNIVHIGNYIGALKQWVEIQHRHRCLFCVVDLHAITVPQDPKMLRENSLRMAATYLAVGIDPKRSHIFIQSEVPQHTELSWILETIAKISELERMTQYKDKAKKRGENVGVGLFTYPVLMAADILLYDTTAVPVGEDQMQHLEFTRVLARRFNETFGETFIVPQPLIQKVGARIMGLDDPHIKMSKSASSVLNYIALTDDADLIIKKLSKAVTDSDGKIVYDVKNKPAISNLLTIYHHATGKTLPEIEAEFSGKRYGDFKKSVAEALIFMLSPIQEKITLYQQDPGQLQKILDAGRTFALDAAEKKMNIVRERVGLGRS